MITEKLIWRKLKEKIIIGKHESLGNMRLWEDNDHERRKEKLTIETVERKVEGDWTVCIHMREVNSKEFVSYRWYLADGVVYVLGFYINHLWARIVEARFWGQIEHDKPRFSVPKDTEHRPVMFGQFILLYRGIFHFPNSPLYYRCYGFFDV